MFDLLGTPWNPLSAIVVTLELYSVLNLSLGEAVHKLKPALGRSYENHYFGSGGWADMSTW